VKALFSALGAMFAAWLGRTVKSTTPRKPAPTPPVRPSPPSPHFLASLRIADTAALTVDDYRAVASRLNCDWAAVAAVAEVESGRLGAFGADGRPVILFEKHLFSRKTHGVFDRSHSHISNPRAGGPYPASQTDRWRQFTEAFALDPEAALESTSWGRFQLLGQNYANLGFMSARDYVAKIARSERDGLEAFEAFISANGLAPALRAKDWATFARRYNGANYAVNRYDVRMRDAYERLTANRAQA
jgi:hypothetical protein